MNRILKTLLIGGALAAFAVPAVGFAFDGPGESGPMAADQGAHLERKLARMTAELDLTDAQVAAIQTIFESSKPQAQALRQQARSSMQALNAAIDGGADNDTIAEAAIDAHDARDAIKDFRKGVRQQVGQVLTPEQKAKVKEMRQSRGGQHGPGKRGGNRGGGPRGGGFGGPGF